MNLNLKENIDKLTQKFEDLTAEVMEMNLELSRANGQLEKEFEAKLAAEKKKLKDEFWIEIKKQGEDSYNDMKNSRDSYVKKYNNLKQVIMDLNQGPIDKVKTHFILFLQKDTYHPELVSIRHSKKEIISEMEIYALTLGYHYKEFENSRETGDIFRVFLEKDSPCYLYYVRVET
jgi:predicted nuclease with TOPRIM domain